MRCNRPFCWQTKGILLLSSIRSQAERAIRRWPRFQWLALVSAFHRYPFPLNELANLCYTDSMLKAYVGIASNHGLSFFQPERADALTLVRCSVGNGHRHFGFWVYLHDAEANSIQMLFRDGYRR